MSQQSRLSRQPERPLPGPIGHTLRGLAGWAVAASLGAAGGCASQHPAEDLSQPVPQAGQGGTGVVPPEPAGGSSAGSGVAVLPPSADGGPGVSDAAAPIPVHDSGVPPVAADAGMAWVSVACSSTGGKSLLAQPLNLARKVDSMEVFIGAYRDNGPPELATRVISVGAMGMRCATASDPNACGAKLTELAKPSAACQNDFNCAPFAIVSAGDSAQRIDSQTDLVSLLGSIDTPTEAAVIAVWNGMTVACPKPDPNFPLRGTQVLEDETGYLVRSEWEECSPATRETLHVDRNGMVGALMKEVLRMALCAIGRRPLGLQAAAPQAMPTPLAAFFANAAHLEAASVYAFERLARELLQLEAPAELIAEAVNSALDEIRHAQLVTALARRYGGEPSAVSVTHAPVRTRFEIALENAREGCVRETYGALIAQHQAALASDPMVAAVMATIAADEIRHAELAWRVAAWLEPQLDARERASIALAQRVAWLELAAEAATEALSEHAARSIGWPSARVAQALVQRMASSLGLV